MQEQVWRDDCLHAGSAWAVWGDAGAGGSTRPFAFARRSQVLVPGLGVRCCAASCVALTPPAAMSPWPCMPHGNRPVLPSPACTLHTLLPLTLAPLPRRGCPGKLIHLYRVFARQLTYSLSTNHAEPSVSHHQSQNLLPSTPSRGLPMAPRRGLGAGQGPVPVHAGAATPRAPLYFGKPRLRWEELSDLVCSWAEMSSSPHQVSPANISGQLALQVPCMQVYLRNLKEHIF